MFRSKKKHLVQTEKVQYRAKRLEEVGVPNVRVDVWKVFVGNQFVHESGRGS